MSRTETDPVSGASPSTIYYSRYQYVPGGIYPNPIDDFGIARRTIVTEPAGNGSPSYATRYLFHVDVTSAVFASGIELERRYYSGPNALGTPLRTLVNCYEDDLGSTGQCGYRDGSGAIQDYTVRDNNRQQRQLTWYGVNPTQGGTCPTGSTPCTASVNVSSEYVVAAGKYKATTVTSTLPAMTGWTSRVSRTEWNPQTGSVWLLDLFTGKSVTDNGSGLPAPASVSTTYNFNLGNGFLNGTTTTDSYGSLMEFFSNDSQWNPASETRSGTGGVSTTQFTDNRTFQSGLVLTSQRSGIGWKSFDVDHDAKTGAITLSRDPNYSTADGGHQALRTIYGYDVLGRLTSITPQWGETGTSISYDTPTMTTVTRSGSDGNSTWQRYLYDGFGRLIREIRGLPTGYATRTHAYDQPGHAYFASEWGSCGDPNACLNVSPPGTTSSSFDSFGRPRTITKADGSQTTVDRTDGSITFSDSLEKVTVSVAGTLATTETRRDALGRIVTVTEPLVNGTADQTSYQYNALDKLAVVTQGQQQRNFVYDSFGFLRSETTPERGLVSYSSYDALGDVLSESPAGVAISRSYDLAGRVTLVTTNESGSPTYLSNFYDQNPAFNFSLGKLTTRYGSNPGVAGSPTVSDVFVYNGLGGRLSAQSTAVSGLTAIQSWFYNGLGLISHHYHPRLSGQTPFVVSTTYSQGLPTSQYVNGIPAVTGVTYAPSGALQSYTTGLFSGKTVTTTIAPDGFLPRPSRISTMGASTNFDTGTYSYDGVGNIMAIGADGFSYDLRSRLSSASLSGVGSQALTYDRYGNLLTKGGTTFCSGTCANNQVTGGSFLRGNLTSYGGQSFAYDGLDRMTSSTQSSLTWSYLYDGSDERTAKIPPTGSATYTFRDESKRVASEFSGTTWSRDNVFLGSQLVASYANGGVGGNGPVWVFFASDHLGTPRLLTDVATNLAEPQLRRYWPYGETATTSGTFEALRFATMEFDAEGGTSPGLASDRYYDHARIHVGGLGRFLSADLIQGDEVAPESWNRYAYAMNNPLRFVDPSGLITATVYGEAPTASTTFDCDQGGTNCTLSASAPRPDLSGLTEFFSNSFFRQVGTAFTDNGIHGLYERRAAAAYGRGAYFAFTIDKIGGVLFPATPIVDYPLFIFAGLENVSARLAGLAGKQLVKAAAKEGMTCQEFISLFRQGSVKAEFPGQYLEKPIKELLDDLARTGSAAAKTAYKILKESRFGK